MRLRLAAVAAVTLTTALAGSALANGEPSGQDTFDGIAVNWHGACHIDLAQYESTGTWKPTLTVTVADAGTDARKVRVTWLYMSQGETETFGKTVLPLRESGKTVTQRFYGRDPYHTGEGHAVGFRLTAPHGSGWEQVSPNLFVDCTTA